jgi:hypothetical protein
VNSIVGIGLRFSASMSVSGFSASCYSIYALYLASPGIVGEIGTTSSRSVGTVVANSSGDRVSGVPTFPLIFVHPI